MQDFVFKSAQGWERIASLPEAKKKLGCISVKVAHSNKTGKSFGLFIKPDGSYLTTKLDKAVDVKKLADAYLWHLGDGVLMIGLSSYSKSATILGEL